MGLGSALPGRRVAVAPSDSGAAGDVRGLRAQPGAQPAGDGPRRQPGSASRPARRAGASCAIAACRSRSCGARATGSFPRESFEALCVASGVEGTVVDGSHSWLLADPQQFAEVITNDVRVAQAARRPRARSRAHQATWAQAGPDPASTEGSRGPATRRSPRRRVIPRASSSLTSGSAYLRETSSVSRSCETVKPSLCVAQQSRDDLRATWSIVSAWKYTPSRSTISLRRSISPQGDPVDAVRRRAVSLLPL